MPRYLTQDGKKIPNVRTQKAWFLIPTQGSRKTDTFLIPTKVADYIEKLESQIK